MKSSRLILIAIIFLINTIVLAGQKSFTAQMLKVTQGIESVYQVQSDGNMYRYDFVIGGTGGIVIVDPAKGKTAVLMPEEKFVHYTETSSGMSRSNDPVQALMTLKDRYTEKKMGSEKIAGYNCKKSELFAEEDKIFTLWFSEELNFPLRIENNLSEGTYMVLSNIVERKVDPDIFIVPADYTEVDNRLRPVIPEPPPPLTWNRTEVKLPLKAVFQRGDLVSFRVPESRNYKVNLKNETPDPAKIIRISMRDGKELPDNEQGPLRYRTNRIFRDESTSGTFSWKAGDEKIIQDHEGKLLIEILPEER